MINLKATMALAIAVAFATPSFSHGVPEAIPVHTPPPKEEKLLYTNVCASYYKYGTVTASGVRYRKTALTAASKTLPFGTLLKVTNIANGRVVHVTVTDRGPYVRGRTLDLSLAAAKKLDMIKTGTARVSAYTE